MKIVKLILHNYKRLFLNNILHIEYTPKTKTQIILGQNGSGKSSLLEQLTPISPNVKKDFNDNGYREITIEHNDQQYVLRNERIGKHSFKLEGYELNDGGTVSVQNTLVNYHFGITPHIQQVLLGKSQFTTMSPVERKRWITEISTIDYSYPITVYNSLKQRHRDIVGGIKLLQTNIVRVEKSALPDALITNLVNDKQHISNIVDHMLTLINQTSRVDDLDSKTNKVYGLIKKLKLASDIVTPVTLELLSKQCMLARTKKDIITIQVTELYSKLEEVTEEVSLEDKTTISLELAAYKLEIANILDGNRFSNIIDIEYVVNYLNSNYADIVALLSTLTEYSELDLNKERVSGLHSKKSIMEVTITQLEKKLYKLEERLEHLEHHRKAGKEITCPKCTYQWVPAYTEEEYVKYQNEITLTTKQLTESKERLTSINTELEHVDIVRNVVSVFIRFLSHNADTKLFLQYITNSDSYIAHGHSSLFLLFEQIKSEVTRLFPVLELRNKQKVAEQKLLEISNNTKIHKNVVEDTKTKLLEYITSNRMKIKELDSTIAELESNITVKKTYLSNIDMLKSVVSDIYSAKTEIIETNKNMLLKKAIRELRMLLLDIENKLTTHKEYETTLNMYQTELTILNTKQRLLKLTLKELSPSEGLIAKSISSFLNCFINDMNTIISSIWGYEMEILNCDLGDNDLDYKFKVLVNNDEVIEDISKTSSSMQEIINLVFKIIFSKYKGFIGYPLILDEFGKTFDNHHRITAYETLERNISNDFSQIYMVSHFTEMYGRFGNADISILGTTGVEMTTVATYNEVMSIQ